MVEVTVEGMIEEEVENTVEAAVGAFKDFDAVPVLKVMNVH